MDESTLKFYERQAAELFDQYQSVPSPHRDLIRHFFSPGEKILDIGCGSGREVSVLRDEGFDSYGMDPSQPLLAMAASRDHRLAGRLVRGSLPGDVGAHVKT